MVRMSQHINGIQLDMMYESSLRTKYHQVGFIIFGKVHTILYASRGKVHVSSKSRWMCLPHHSGYARWQK